MKHNLFRRVGLTSITALVAGLLVVIPVTPAAATHPALDATNAAANAGIINESMFVATQTDTTAVIHPATAVATTGHAARSTGLTAKSTATAAASQTATVRAGGVLSLYAQVSTTSAFTATGGSFTAGDSAPSTATTDATGFVFTGITSATPIAVLWQSPTTAGSYTVTFRTATETAASVPAASTGSTVGRLAASIVVTVTAAAHDVVGGTNYPLFPAKANDALFVAVQNSTTGSKIVTTSSTTNDGSLTARSIGLLSKDTTVSTAQTATVLASGALSLYANVSTNVAFIGSGGSFSGAVVNNSTTNASYSNDIRTVFLPGTASQLVAVSWNAPSTPGTYTISMNRAAATQQVTPTAATYSSGTLTGAITVTVVAATAGGAYSAAYSACNTRSNADGVGVATGVDTTTAITNGQVSYIAFDLDDAYDASLDPGALVVTATNGALVSLGTSAAAAAAGTTSTIVSTVAPTNQVVQVIQGTSNAPVTSTVTITYNGTTVCTKTVTIRGEVASLTVANVGTNDLGSGSTGSATWIADGTNRIGIFTVTAKDSAGNTVAPGVAGVSGFAAVAATLTTTVQAITISSANVATSISSSTAAWNYSVGNFTCGSTAGESKVKVQYTNPATGTVATSAEFTARCADDPYTYTAGFDKASYVQGELATLTVQFLDSKGNKANNVGAHGALTDSTPMFTEVTAQGDGVADKADGTNTYTYTVGGTTAVTAGAYTAIIDFASLTAVAAVKATPSYKVSTGGDSTTNADVLKSIVALIASINKQIQALQKLILKR